METVSFDCLTGIASAQVSENYDSELNVICGIGGEMSSANYTMSGRSCRPPGSQTAITTSSAQDIGTGVSRDSKPAFTIVDVSDRA